MSAIERTKYETEVQAIREALADWLAKGIEVVVRLRGMELDGLWRVSGCRDFSEFLNETFRSAIGIQHYRHVVNAIEHYGLERVCKFGPDGCAAVTASAIVDSPERKQQLLELCDEFEREHGIPASAKKIRGFVYGDVAPELHPPSPEAKSLQRKSEWQQKAESLQGELREAHKRIRELEAQAKKHEKTIAKLRGKPTQQHAAE
jgi:hypothetical protein